jgi:hypothetical protein
MELHAVVDDTPDGNQTVTFPTLGAHSIALLISATLEVSKIGSEFSFANGSRNVNEDELFPVVEISREHTTR